MVSAAIVYIFCVCSLLLGSCSSKPSLRPGQSGGASAVNQNQKGQSQSFDGSSGRGLRQNAASSSSRQPQKQAAAKAQKNVAIVADDDVHQEQIPDTKETTEAALYEQEQRAEQKSTKHQQQHKPTKSTTVPTKHVKTSKTGLGKSQPFAKPVHGGGKPDNRKRRQAAVAAGAKLHNLNSNSESRAKKQAALAGKSRRRRQAILLEEPATEDDVEELAVLIKALQRLNRQSAIIDDYDQSIVPIDNIDKLSIIGNQQQIDNVDDGNSYDELGSVAVVPVDYGEDVDEYVDDESEQEPDLIADMIKTDDDAARNYYTRERRALPGAVQVQNYYEPEPVLESDVPLEITPGEDDYYDDENRLVYEPAPGIESDPENQDVEVVVLPFNIEEMTPIDRAELQDRIDRMAVLLNQMKRRRK